MTLAPQHLTLLARLPCLPAVEYKTLPPVTAIYIVIQHGGDVLYVGKSRNLVQRWRSHHRAVELVTADTWIAWIVAPTDIDDRALMLLERRCIHSFQPRYNDMPMERKPSTDTRAFADKQRYLETLLNQEIAACQEHQATIAATEHAIIQSEAAALRWLRQYRKGLAAIVEQRQQQHSAVAAQIQRMHRACIVKRETLEA